MQPVWIAYCAWLFLKSAHQNVAIIAMEWERTAGKCQCDSKCVWDSSEYEFICGATSWIGWLVDSNRFSLNNIDTSPQSSKLQHLSLFRLTFGSINIKFPHLLSAMLRFKKHLHTQTNTMSNGIGRCHSKLDATYHAKCALLNFQ